MIRRPPRSTLFPYTTSSDLRRGRPGGLPAAAAAAARDCQRLARSEEHTSELQSRRDLVCRLLLEKKISRHGLLLAPPLYLHQGGRAGRGLRVPSSSVQLLPLLDLIRLFFFLKLRPPPKSSLLPLPTVFRI